jgi:beta-lactamase superfamily II metal-dependent hydrolase
MAYEVDIIAVGDESHSGDAIAIRYGNFIQNPGDQKIIVIDGGYAESGAPELINRIRNQYGTDTVDLVISTHPDNDHISGLHTVLDELVVKELWMHRPWTMSESVKRFIETPGLSILGLTSKLKKSLDSAHDLEKLANSKNIPIKEPLQGLNFDNHIFVLGPSKDFYCQLVADFEKTQSSGLLQKIKRLFSEAWHKDELVDPADDAVSARNNSSTVLVASLDSKNFLFTGDAGVPALNHAADYADSKGFTLPANIHFYQIPHHGSKRNVGPTVLNRVIGPILQQGQSLNKHGFISAAVKGEPKHPSHRVKNALLRRGLIVSATQGTCHCFKSDDVPTREGWGPVKPLSFSDSYEDEE